MPTLAPLLRKEGQGWPRFDAERASTYFARVNDKPARLLEVAIRKWALAGL